VKSSEKLQSVRVELGLRPGVGWLWLLPELREAEQRFYGSEAADGGGPHARISALYAELCG